MKSRGKREDEGESYVRQRKKMKSLAERKGKQLCISKAD